jgi:hypothetical protein
MKKPKPPIELKTFGRKMWNVFVDEYEITDSAGLALLLAACRAEDDIQRMRNVLEKEGDICLTDKSRCHPLHAAIRAAETTRRQSIRALNCDVGPDSSYGPGRPPQE